MPGGQAKRQLSRASSWRAARTLAERVPNRVVQGQKLPEPLMNLVRLSRGKMLGVDFNKGLDWVGSTVALWPKAE